MDFGPHAAPERRPLARVLLIGSIVAAGWSLSAVLLGASSAHADDGGVPASAQQPALTATVGRALTGATGAAEDVVAAPVDVVVAPTTRTVSVAAVPVRRSVAPVVQDAGEAVSSGVTTVRAVTAPVTAAVTATASAVEKTVRGTTAPVTDTVREVVDDVVAVPVVPLPSVPVVDLPIPPDTPGAPVAPTAPPAMHDTPAPAPVAADELVARERAADLGTTPIIAAAVLPRATAPTAGARAASGDVRAPEAPAPLVPNGPAAPTAVVATGAGGLQSRSAAAGGVDALAGDRFRLPELLAGTLPGAARTSVPGAPAPSFDITPD